MRTAMGTRMQQSATLTSQLIQSIRLLQLTTQEMQQELSQALLLNPMLETEEEESHEIEVEAADETPAAADVAESCAPVEIVDTAIAFDGSEFSFDGNDFDDRLEQQQPAPQSSDIRVRILEQMTLTLRDRTDVAIAEWLVELVDDNGYLEMPLETLTQEGMLRLHVQGYQIERIRQIMMRQEPTGFGASTLAECLTVQLEFVDADAALLAFARCIVRDHLQLLAQHDYAALAAILGTDAGIARRAVEIILTLEPRPGAQATEAQAIVPEISVRRGMDGWQVDLNSTCAPRIRINVECEKLLQRSGDSAGAKALRDLLNDARWLVRGLAMRQETLMKVAVVVVERQRTFLDRGEEHLCSLTLREVADAIGMHESTVSRVTTGKYIQTPRGTFELKYFFSARLDGAALAGRAVRALVKRLIEGESLDAPLADDDIAVLLARQGVRIARRTVAKYRDQLEIAPAKERRRRGSTVINATRYIANRAPVSLALGA
jgi:RNA polymerase sigma-54 factor